MASPQTPSGAVCLFRAGGSRWFVDLESVAGVLDPGPPMDLPLASERIWGLCFHGGRVLPVAQIGGSRRDRVLVLVLKSDRGLWGLAIDPHGVEVGSIAPPHEQETETRLNLNQFWDELRFEIEEGYARVTGSPASESRHGFSHDHERGVGEECVGSR